MNLSIGIVGLPNVGKSTLFNALTKNDVLAANYPFATIEPNTGIVAVPDERLNVLQEMFNAKEKKPATVKFLDIAGLVKGASEGEGLGNQFLSNIRSANAICQVVRTFEDGNVQHVSNKVDPKSDIETINTELILADMQSLSSRKEKLEREAKSDPKARPALEELKKAQDILDSGNTLYSQNFQFEELEDIDLLTTKPFLYAFNISEDRLDDGEHKKELAEMVAPAEAVFVSAKVEAELISLSDEEKDELLKELGQDESSLVRLVQAAYDTLDLQSFLTAGEKEVRAWTIRKGATAPEAAGAIHTDFQRGFIAAEVVNYSDLVNAGSWSEAKNKGRVRTEGKDYVMKPDDVVEFRFNV